MENSVISKVIPKRFRGCLIKKFPRVFQYQGKDYIIEESQKKYYNSRINVTFLEEYAHPIATDRYGDHIRNMSRKESKVFSECLSRISQLERKNRTLSLKKI